MSGLVRIAYKLLVNDRGKFIAVLMGITFSVFLMSNTCKPRPPSWKPRRSACKTASRSMSPSAAGIGTPNVCSAPQSLRALDQRLAAFAHDTAYRDLFTASEASCSPVGEPGTILGYPPCVYGMSMYLVLVVIAALGLANTTAEQRRLPPSAAATRA